MVAQLSGLEPARPLRAAWNTTTGGGVPVPKGEVLNPRRAGARRHPRRAAGGGVFEHPPSNSAPDARRRKRKKASESSSKIISKLLRSFFRSGQQ